MGAVNYGTGDIINIGLNVNEVCDEWDAQAVRDEVENILARYECYFDILRVRVVPGYYDGFYICIDNDPPCIFDTYAEKRDAQKELTALKKCLLECVGCGMVEYIPGWCTGYSTPAETVKSIKSAIQWARNEVKNIPTWKTYSANRAGVQA